MRLEARKYLYDIQRATNRLREFTSGKTFADYEANPMLRSAVSISLRSLDRRRPTLPRSMKQRLA